MATLAAGATKPGRGAKPAELAYVLVFAPAGTSLAETVEAFGARWTVEQCFEEGSQTPIRSCQSSTTVGVRMAVEQPYHEEDERRTSFLFRCNVQPDALFSGMI